METNVGRRGLQAAKMAQPPAKRQPVFTSIAQLRPDTSGHNLTVKVRTWERMSREDRACMQGAANLTAVEQCLV